MLDHINIPVSDPERSRRFFETALSPLGYELVMEHDISGVGFGHTGKPEFWIKQGATGTPVHVAFACPDRATVDAFYEAAIGAGGRDYGPPGPRPEYHQSYYGAYVLDPDGNNIEVVCHRPQT